MSLPSLIFSSKTSVAQFRLNVRIRCAKGGGGVVFPKASRGLSSTIQTKHGIWYTNPVYFKKIANGLQKVIVIVD